MWKVVARDFPFRRNIVENETREKFSALNVYRSDSWLRVFDSKALFYKHFRFNTINFFYLLIDSAMCDWRRRLIFTADWAAHAKWLIEEIANEARAQFASDKSWN